MAVTSSFGSQPSAAAANVPKVLVLIIVTRRGSFPQTVPAAASTDAQDLELFLAAWLKQPQNREAYVASKIVDVPFVAETHAS